MRRKRITRRSYLATFPLLARIAGLVILGLGILLAALDQSATSQESGDLVVVASVTGTIDLGLAPYLERVLKDAADDGAEAVLVEIDTPGGRLDAVLQMRDALLGSSVPTIAFVDRTAFSAGALVAIASEQIYMTPGAAMGAATPVDGVTGEEASEKTVSAVRSTFASTAEARGRDPLIAEAMVDPAVVIDGLDGPDQLLTLTATQALDVGYAEGIVDTREELLTTVGLGDAEVREVSMTFIESAVRFLTDPIIASLLMLGGLLLIVGSFFSEGFGPLTLVGVALLGVFFFGHMLAGLAGWEGVLLVVLGLALIAVELLVIPGFGIPGILGLIALAAGIFLSLADRDVRTPERTNDAILATVVILAGLLIGTIAMFALLPKTRVMSRLVLADSLSGSRIEPAAEKMQTSDRGWLGWFGGGSMPASRSHIPEPVPEPDAAPPPILVSRPLLPVGHVGVALSDLRPAGTARFNDERFDVVTNGEYVAAGAAIEVVRDDEYRIVVRRAQS